MNYILILWCRRTFLSLRLDNIFEDKITCRGKAWKEKSSESTAPSSWCFKTRSITWRALYLVQGPCTDFMCAYHGRLDRRKCARGGRWPPARRFGGRTAPVVDGERSGARPSVWRCVGRGGGRRPSGHTQCRSRGFHDFTTPRRGAQTVLLGPFVFNFLFHSYRVRCRPHPRFDNRTERRRTSSVEYIDNWRRRFVVHVYNTRYDAVREKTIGAIIAHDATTISRYDGRS